MKAKKIVSSLFFYLSVFLCSKVFALDPATNAANQMKGILFGGLGVSLSAIIIGATFIMANTGKISWDRFVFIGFCTAGFLGSPAIVGLIQSWVR